MSVKCFVCSDEFIDMPALARHCKKYHPKEQAAEGKPVSSICPLCGFHFPGTRDSIVSNRTVCSNCLCTYDPYNGQFIEPPPEFCLAEKAGMPCKSPKHKYYFKQYIAALK